MGLADCLGASGAAPGVTGRGLGAGLGEGEAAATCWN